MNKDALPVGKDHYFSNTESKKKYGKITIELYGDGIVDYIEKFSNLKIFNHTVKSVVAEVGTPTIIYMANFVEGEALKDNSIC